MILNETPVRTSNNFRINNIEIDELSIPSNISDFNNCNITKGDDITCTENLISNFNLKFGMGEELNNLSKQSSNKNLTLVIDSKKDSKTSLEFNFDRQNDCLIENILISANANTKSTIVLKYLTEQDIKVFHNGIIKIEAQENSSVNVIIVNLLNNKSYNFLSLDINEKKNANINVTSFELGGKYSITNYYSNLNGDNSENKLNTVYIGNDNQIFDINYIAELYGKKSNIDIDVQGALNDNAKKHFKGTIDFKKGCKKAVGNENENCILLSEKAKSIALPMLLCTEEDVEGNHSSSAGKIEEKELFYIMSRGVSKKEAIKLMVRAKFNRILENIKNEELFKLIDNEIDKRLN